MSDFVDTPMPDQFVKSVTKGGPGTYNGDDCPPFGEYKRTPSSNGVPEKIIDGSVPKPSGESDQF
jgi:hypothetical protein